MSDYVGNVCEQLKNIYEGCWPGGSVGQSILLILQGCGFGPQSGYIQESTNEYVSKWNNKSMFLFLFFLFSIKSIKINLKKKKEEKNKLPVDYCVVP